MRSFNIHEVLSCLHQVLEHWVEGDASLDLELQGALSDKSTSFQATEISLLKGLVKKHVAESERKRLSLGLSGPSIQATELERQSFDIAMQTFQHDLQQYKIWLSRSRDREAALYYQELSHAQARKKQALQIAGGVMDRTSSTWRVEVARLESPNESLKHVHSMKQQSAKMENLGSGDSVLTLVLLNWAAPSTYTTGQQNCQSALAGATVNEENCLGIVLTPVHFHKKGMLYKLEEMCNKLLSQANANCDMGFALPFTGKTDERERRTLVQPGRFMMAMDEDRFKHNMAVWRTVPLMKKPLVEEAILTPTRDLLVIEDVSEDSLPATTDMNTSINPPEKHQQIGVDAARKLLRSLTQGLESNSGRSALLVLDLSMHTDC